MSIVFKAYLLLGSNLGDRLNNLTQAEELIYKQCGSLMKSSSIYETAAWGLEKQPSFLNKVIQIKTNLTALDLLEAILHIEALLGRKRTVKMGPRVIDIDILFMENFNHITSSQLTIPHPAIAQRRFVLIPLNELMPDFIHPILNKSIAQLLELCTDTLSVKKFLA